MKRIICNVPDEDAVKIIGTLVKLGLDFSVETLSTDEVPAPVRHIQRRAEDGRGAKEVILDALAEKSPRSQSELVNIFVSMGFNGHTAGATVSRLVKDGLVRRARNLVYAVEGQKS